MAHPFAVALFDPGPRGDIVSLTNLQLPHGIWVPDCWNSQQVKEQPVLLSTNILLKNGFTTVANHDRLDNNTVHYGKLAKTIRLLSSPEQDVNVVLDLAHRAVTDIIETGSGKAPSVFMADIMVELTLPKSTMSGKHAKIIQVLSFPKGEDQAARSKFLVEDIQTMTLIGVNAVERTAMQPLLITFSLAHAWTQWPIARLYLVEDMLVKYIQSTSFETLESLVEATYAIIAPGLVDSGFKGAQFRLAIKKPKAVTFADAPCIEIWRTL